MKKIFFDKGSAMHRILAILERVASSDIPVTPTEINDNLNLPKATIHRLLQHWKMNFYYNVKSTVNVLYQEAALGKWL